VGEDQVVVAVVDGAGRPVVEGGEEAVGHGDGAAGGEVGLAVGGVFAADPGVADADALGGPVDVAPAQAEQFGLA
jgi:hypothetical protein